MKVYRPEGSVNFHSLLVQGTGVIFLDGKDVLRIWNIQLISYAGYQSEHDSNVIIGDPGNVSFTQFCQSLGWTGKGNVIL